MEEDNPTPPKPARPRKPRAKSGTRAAGAAGVTRAKRTPAASPDAGESSTSTSRSSSSPNGNPEPPPQFDHLVEDDGFVRDFDRIASGNPKSVVLTALFVGVALGFFAALILSRD